MLDRTSVRRLAATVGLAAGVAAGSVVVASPASADVPEPWQERTNICQTLSYYSQNPAYNPGITPTHAVGGHKRMWWTSGEIVDGWVPVYSAGQQEWHTGWVRGECLAAGWVGPDDGYVIS